MSYIDEIVSSVKSSFERSKLKPIFDNLGLKPGGRYSIGGDDCYMSLRLYAHDAEVREYYHNGKVYVYFDYDNSVGAWGGYTRKYEVKDPAIFKSPRWKDIIKSEGVKASPDVIMI